MLRSTQLRNHSDITDGYQLIAQIMPNSTDRPVPVDSRTFTILTLIPSKGIMIAALDSNPSS